MPFFRISEGEYLALFLAERLLQAFGDTPVAKDLVGFFSKVKAILPDTVSLDPSHLVQSFSARPSTQSLGDAKQFQALVSAIDKGQQLELVYWTASRDDTLRRIVDPYHLTLIDGEWFLLGHCHLRDEVRTFVPGRIRSMKPTGAMFDRPVDFRIANYIDGGFRKFHGSGKPQLVRLRFSKSVAPLIRERTWHSSQMVTANVDGSIDMTFQLVNLLEVKRWVQSWAPDCEVLEPDNLRKDIERDLRASLERLSDDRRI